MNPRQPPAVAPMDKAELAREDTDCFIARASARPNMAKNFGSMRAIGGANSKKVLRKARRSLASTRVDIQGTFFQEARPVEGNTYFPASKASTAVVICLYNEVGPELSRTIESLAASDMELDMVVVADGLAKLSESMKSYLRTTFELKGASAASLLNGEPPAWGPQDQIFISRPAMKRAASVTLLLKRFNHKKINTHEWFFRAHCPNTGCRFALTTDTGAVFRPGSLDRMVRFETHPGVAAVTGRQRVMSEYHQRVHGRAAMGEEVERDTIFEKAMRLLQGFDFEIDHTGGKAVSCAAGLLPCLHGPCAFFRYEVMRGRALDEYFDDWGYAAPHSLKLIGANLQLAEDRIPSLLGVLYSGGQCSDSSFGAVFEFEAELSLKAFMTQRRRWINGTIAGLIYALSQTPAIFRSPHHSLAFKFANLLALSMQTLGFLLMFLTPALFGFLFGAAVGMLATHALPSHPDVVLALRAASMAVYGGLYVLFVAAHAKRTTASDCVYRPRLTKVVLAYNVLMAALVFAAVVVNFVVEGAWFLLAVYASVPGLPMLSALIGGDIEGAWLILKAFPVFALVSPSFVGSLSAYSASRIADLTWGNRPAASADERQKRRRSLAQAANDDESVLNRWLARQARRMFLVNTLLVLANLGLMVGAPWLVPALAIFPSIAPSWSLVDGESVFFAGALELYLIFSFAWLVQQIIGVGFHTLMTLKALGRCVRGTSTSSQRVRARMDIHGNTSTSTKVVPVMSEETEWSDSESSACGRPVCVCVAAMRGACSCRDTL